MLVTTKKMLDIAMRRKFAIAQPNAWDLHSLRAIIKTADKNNTAVIVGLGEVHFKYMNPEEFIALGRLYANHVKVPVALHLDHGNSFNGILRAIRAGFTSVMIDASSKPYEENVRYTKEIVKIAHACGVTVEAELGHVGIGAEYDNKKDLLTSPVEAKKFIEETKIDSLAVAIGTAHGEYKQKPEIDFERLKEIRNNTNIPLVLHGGSGTGETTINKCVKNGISKVNICTDLLNAASKKINEDKTINYADLCIRCEEAISNCLEKYFMMLECAGTAELID